ncbi:MAG: leucyl aminopeptidase family protein [Phycisphaeraceae bacterium]|nr:MAG: leucyl aminopeptidase family protein [Phycisphaeraceae bacterium]
MFNSVTVSEKGKGVVVVGHFKGQGLDRLSKRAAPQAGVAGALKRKEATGDVGRIVEAWINPRSRVMIVGLGEKSACTPQTLRDAAAAVGRRLAASKDDAATLAFSGPAAQAGIDAAIAGEAIGEAIGLLSWSCDEFRGSATPKAERTDLAIRSDDRAMTSGMKTGLQIAQGVNLARTLSQTPPNIATPSWMAAQARKLARATGLKARIVEGDELESERMTGLINVGKASENKPCLIRLEYTPKSAKARAAKPLVLVGKTITYDTGGLSLKINNMMVGMKRDKDGGCAVLGAMHAIATVIKPDFPVVALLAAAENSISDEAYRPDDVIRYRNGVTVEVTNTDAEGRLVLADALIWACEVEKPRAIIDLATLTGGVITALGSTYAGLFCDNDQLRGAVECAAAGSGELVWRLPYAHADYRDMMKSPVADILNSNPNRKAHATQGAAFLANFVQKDVPWCHLDIAGVHVAEKNAGMYIDGPTGWGTRLLAHLIRSMNRD